MCLKSRHTQYLYNMEPSLAASLSHFAARFANELEKGKSQVCSPLSAQAVLALTALGSGGDTRKELLEAMALSDDEALRSLFSYVTSTTKSVEGITLKMANKVYVTNKSKLQPDIQKDAKEVFQSALEQLDFTESAAAAGAVNKWVRNSYMYFQSSSPLESPSKASP
ncbi:antichymotrypsin-2-like [Cydia pomonella]|uniref:antichymotrypsin-2-like n=1 Tax=Cydia pomonella TaxID=82600 RepID=UPI002ADE420A|nr:antichymotrypsin-2-like [Cydia pomonella]